jgi:TP901 family phage tail tape measure protein
MMADEIKQVFTIDASDALTKISQLDKEFQTLQSRLLEVAKTLQSVNRSANKSSKNYGNAANAAKDYADQLDRLSKILPPAPVKPIGKQVSQDIKDADAATRKWTVSWETLSRVVITQFIVRAMSQIRNAINEAVRDAIEFQRQVALIQTIADGASFDSIAENVRKVSDNFNIPLLEAAAGVYQALSNQVGNFEESLRFTEEASKFAKATNSSLSDSVDLLSGALRSYGLDVEDTGRVSGIFFTAIDKGRITADQLANSLGRVLEPASEIGIELEELSGAIAAISEKGLGTAETLTQFRGIITALTKPTDAMKLKLRELGFETTEQAVQTLKLDGLLNELAKSTNGSSQEFAKLFPNVRGLGGALGLTGENLETFSENIKLARENGSEFAQSKFQTATATDAEKLTKALNEVSNALTVDLGQALVATGNNIIEAFGGVGETVKVIQVLAQGIEQASAALRDFEKATGILKALGSVNPLTFFENLKQGKVKDALSEFTKLREENEETAKSLADSEQSRIEQASRGYEQLAQSARQSLRTISIQYIEDVEKAKDADDGLVEKTKSTLDKIVNLRENFLQELNSAISGSRKQIEASLARIQTIQDKQDTRKFESDTRGFNDAQKVAALTQRAADLSRQAEQNLGEAFRTGNDQLKDRALGQFAQADALGEQARNIGERANNRALEARAANELTSNANRQIAAEKQINELQKQRQKALEKERTKQEAILTELRNQTKIAAENTGQFDKNGKQKGAEELARQDAKRQEALLKISQLALQGNDVKAADFLGLGNFLKEIETDAARNPIKLIFDVQSAVAQAKNEIRSAFQDIERSLPGLKLLEGATGQNLRSGTTSEINNALTQVTGELTELEKRKAEQLKLQGSVNSRKAEVESLLSTLETRTRVTSAITAEPLANEKIDEQLTKIRQLIDSGKIAQTDIEAVRKNLSQIDLGTTGDDLNPDVERLKNLLKVLNELSTAQTNQAKLPQVDEARIFELQTVLEAMSTNQPDVKMQTAATAIQNTVTPMTTIGETLALGATNALNIATNLERAAQVQLPQVGTPVTSNAQFGKNMLRYFSNGGFTPRGMDTVPVMARKGESILTPEATNRWFSQIQAMNAGKKPIFRQDGGSVTNIGDVSISVSDSGSPTKTARAVMREFQREKRRGTGR